MTEEEVVDMRTKEGESFEKEMYMSVSEIEAVDVESVKLGELWSEVHKNADDEVCVIELATEYIQPGDASSQIRHARKSLYDSIKTSLRSNGET